MKKLAFKYLFPLTVFIISLILIVFSLLLKLEEKRESEKIYQRILAEQQTQKEIAKKMQEEAEEKLYLMGKFDPSTRKDFVLIPNKYTTVENKMYLREETLDAFLKMQEAADKDEINLKIASATRNFIYQKNLWNNKWTGLTLVEGKNLSKNIKDELQRFKKILEYSAVPGTSRHHWGTEIDINDANPEYFETPKGEEVYEWLTKNAPLFGFCQPYNLQEGTRPKGYNEEKWHWSYLPLAKTFTEEYKNIIKNKDINGFLGDEYVINLDLISNYVLGINLDCL